MLSPSLVLPENGLQYARSLAIVCEAVYHRDSPHYLAEQYIPQARHFAGDWTHGISSWCGCCGFRCLIMRAGEYLGYPAYAGIESGWKAWIAFAREASQEQIKAFWASIDEVTRKVVDDLDRRPIEQQIA